MLLRVSRSMRFACGATLTNVRNNSTATITADGYETITSSAHKHQVPLKSKTIAWEDALPYDSIPGPKPLPIIGNTWRFTHGELKGLNLTDLHGYLHKKYGPICRVTNVLGMNDIVFLFTPELAQEMFRNDGLWPTRNILKVITHYRTVLKKKQFGDVAGLPFSQGEDWFKLRSAVNPIMMQPRTTEEFIPKIDIAARDFVRRVQQLVARSALMPDNFFDEINKYTLESVSFVALNRRFGLMDDQLTPEAEQIIKSTVRIFELVASLDMQPSIWRFFPTPGYREVVKHMDYLTATYMKVIDEEVDRLMAQTTFASEEDKCILQKFLAIDKKVAITMVFDSLAAGVDTTSKTIAGLLYLLGKYKRVQVKLRKELLEVLPDEDAPITAEMLGRCKYLRAVIKESARVHGVAIAHLRAAQKDVVIGGYRIPKATEMIVGHNTICKSEQWIPRAKEFLPERFLRENAHEPFSIQKTNKYVYLPFGFGPRSCVGQRIANLELEISVIALLRKFRLDWRQPNMKFASTIMYGPADPLKLHIYPLEKGMEFTDEEKRIDLDRIESIRELD